MENVTQRSMQVIQAALREVQAAYEAALNQERQVFQSRIQALEKDLQDMQQYRDVSLVNKLTIQVDQLQNENLQLKKRQRLQGSSEPEQSMRSTRSQAPASESLRSRPPAPLPAHEPEPSLRSEATAKPTKYEESERQSQMPMPMPPPERQMAQEVPDEEEPLPDLYLVKLKSGQYFWEPETGNLYARISDEEASDMIVGKIKTMRVRDRYYYQDTSDSNVYEYTASGDIGEHCGSIVNGKFVKN